MIGDSPGSAGGSITGGSGTQVGCGGFSLGGMSTGGSVGEVGGGCIGGMGWGAGNGMGISSIKKAKLWWPKLARTWRRDCQTKPHSHSVICTARSGTGCKRAHASSPATGSLASWSVLAAARWLRGFATLPAPGLAPLMFSFRPCALPFSWPVPPPPQLPSRCVPHRSTPKPAPPCTAGANANAQDAQRDSAYLVAGARGNLPILRLTLAQGADLRSTNRFGGTALIPAAERGHVEAVRQLIAAGADVSWQRCCWPGAYCRVRHRHRFNQTAPAPHAGCCSAHAPGLCDRGRRADRAFCAAALCGCDARAGTALTGTQPIAHPQPATISQPSLSHDRKEKTGNLFSVSVQSRLRPSAARCPR